MVIEYNKCDHCHHKSRDHEANGKCSVRGCTCPGFKPHGS
jgi:hypothetical protein